MPDDDTRPSKARPDPPAEGIGAATTILLRKLTEHLAGEVIGVSARCRRCGYDLKGLEATGACPECGLLLVESVLAIVDPAASTLPRLRDPRRVGNALVWLTVCGLLGVLLMLAWPVTVWLDLAPWGSGILHPIQGPAAAAVCFVTGLWSVFRLRPQTADDPVRRHLRLITVGLLGAATLAVAAWMENRAATPSDAATRSAGRLLLCAAGVLTLIGMGGVLRTIGQRSLAYRRSHAARQGVLAMIAAIIGTAAGAVIRFVGGREGEEGLERFGSVIMGVSTLMVVIGLAYMVLNAWWIRSAIRRPPPTLEQLLTPEPPPAP